MFCMCTQPSLEQFISMNRDIDDGKELPRDMLTVSTPLSLSLSLTHSITHTHLSLSPFLYIFLALETS